MKVAPKWAALLLASVGSWAPTQGCHEFHVCGDRQCEPPQGGALSFAGQAPRGGATPDATAGGNAGGAQAGAASEGGASGNKGVPSAQGGNAGCVAPLADCDESTFDGCEANLLVDIHNCGACRAFCAGACVDGKCSSFEILAEDMALPAWGGIALTSSEVYAISNYSSNSLVRWSPQQGSVAVFTDGTYSRQILTGVDRLYLVGGSDEDELSSILRSGSVVSGEGITARAAVVMGDSLYAIDNAGTPYWLNESSRETGAMPLPAPLSSDFRAWLAADISQLALVAEDGGDGPASYTVYRRPLLERARQQPWERLASGIGRPAQVRVDKRGVYIDVVLAHDETPTADWQIEHELREVGVDGTTRVVATVAGLHNFEIVGRRFYFSVALPGHGSALRVLSLDDPSRVLDVQTSSTMASLTFVWPYFYFGDTSRYALARLPAWLE
jgi:hypothetical protein